MDISNKSLAFVLLATIALSLFTTLAVFNNLDDEAITGFAPTASGIVNLSFTAITSITTADSNLINFGSCVTNDNNLTISSDLPTPNCSSYDTVGELTNISVRNDGNVHVNVTLRPSKVGQIHGGNFLLSPDGGSWIQYRTTNATRNSSYFGGCSSGAIVSYTNLTSNTSEYMVCSNLTTGQFTSVVTNFRLFLPAAVLPGVHSNTITFTATMLV